MPASDTENLDDDDDDDEDENDLSDDESDEDEDGMANGEDSGADEDMEESDWKTAFELETTIVIHTANDFFLELIHFLCVSIDIYKPLGKK